MSFDISFYCRASKVDRNGYAMVQASIIINGERVFINLPRKERPNDFKHPSKDLRLFLDEMHRNINASATDIIAHGHPLTAASLRDYIKTGGYKSNTLDNVIDEFVKLKGATRNKYLRVKELLHKSIPGDTDITRINYGQLQAFYNSLKEQYEQSTSAAMMTKTKAFFSYAFANGYIKSNPALLVKVTKGRPKIDYLTPEEIEKITTAHFENSRIENVRKAFVLQLATGLAYTDLRNLRTSDIKTLNGTLYINKPRAKTDEVYTAVVLPFAHQIIKEGLPKIDSNQRYNNYLKELGALCGIDKDLHTHLARHSYCMYLLNVLRVPIEIASKSLGHSNTKVTQAHYGYLIHTTVIDKVAQALKNE